MWDAINARRAQRGRRAHKTIYAQRAERIRQQSVALRASLPALLLPLRGPFGHILQGTCCCCPEGAILALSPEGGKRESLPQRGNNEGGLGSCPEGAYIAQRGILSALWAYIAQRAERGSADPWLCQEKTCTLSRSETTRSFQAFAPWGGLLAVAPSGQEPTQRRSPSGNICPKGLRRQLALPIDPCFAPLRGERDDKELALPIATLARRATPEGGASLSYALPEGASAYCTFRCWKGYPFGHI